MNDYFSEKKLEYHEICEKMHVQLDALYHSNRLTQEEREKAYALIFLAGTTQKLKIICEDYNIIFPEE